MLFLTKMSYLRESRYEQSNLLYVYQSHHFRVMAAVWRRETAVLRGVLGVVYKLAAANATKPVG